MNITLPMLEGFTTKNENSSAGLSTEILPLHSVQGQNDIIRDMPFDRLRANGKKDIFKGMT